MAPTMSLIESAFEALAAHFDANKDRVRRCQIAFAFWHRLGDEFPEEVAMECIAISETLGNNPAGDMLEQAKENYSTDQLADAALYAARS